VIKNIYTVREEAAQARDRALEWLRTHGSTHSARKLDVKALIAAVDALLEKTPTREPAIQWGIRYKAPSGYEFSTAWSKEQAEFMIQSHPDSGWELAYRTRADPAGPWLMAPKTDG
jgi:hypothetical protein